MVGINGARGRALKAAHLKDFAENRNELKANIYRRRPRTRRFARTAAAAGRGDIVP